MYLVDRLVASCPMFSFHIFSLFSTHKPRLSKVDPAGILGKGIFDSGCRPRRWACISHSRGLRQGGTGDAADTFAATLHLQLARYH